MANKSNRKFRLKKSNLLNNILILAGIVVVVLSLIFIKKMASTTPVTVQQSLEAQFDHYMKERKPTLAFFHSNNCQLCLDMIEVVNQTYPDYKDEIALVDVNVYDPANENLLQREGINSIPTQVFIDSTGQRKVIVGVMTSDQLRQELQILMGDSR